jgi:hypothetical protein
MLIPFISIIIVHILIPLYFTIDTIPLLQVNYNNGKTSLQHHNLMAFSKINTDIVTNKLNKYYDIF